MYGVVCAWKHPHCRTKQSYKWKGKYIMTTTSDINISTEIPVVCIPCTEITYCGPYPGLQRNIIKGNVLSITEPSASSKLNDM